MENFTTLLFEEDQLPPGLEPIQTSSVKQFAVLSRMLMESKALTGYTSMGVVTSRAGVGKSIAIQDFLRRQTIQEHTGFPSCVEMRVKPSANPKTFVEDLLFSVGDRVLRLDRNRYKLADKAAEVILRNDIRLIFVDEADQLNEVGIEFLRYIFGKTGCPLVIVGLPTIFPMLQRHEKFYSRIGPCLDFPPPPDDEIRSLVLPRMHFPHWTYDPHNPEDVALGQEIWSRVKPSFRELRIILQYASIIAQRDPKVTKITSHFLHTRVYPLLEGTRRRTRTTSKAAPEETAEAAAYNEESYQRQDARRKTKEGIPV